MISVDSTPEFVSGVYQKMAQNLAIVRKNLGKPLCLADKILFAHFDDPNTTGMERGIAIPQELVPLAIDEFPAIFIAAANAQGATVLSGAEELRVKESDRIQVMADGLRVLGVDATPTPDGMRIVGKGGGHAATAMAAATSSYTGGEIDSHGDHRIAMAFAMAALMASGAITIRDCANVATSFPGFVELAVRAGLSIKAA